MKSYNEESDEGYFLEVGVRYPETLHDLHNNSPSLPEKMKIEKIETTVAHLHNNTEYVIHIRHSKQALNHGLVLKKFHGVIKSNQKTWLKPYIDMNADLRLKVKNDFLCSFWKKYGKCKKS